MVRLNLQILVFNNTPNLPQKGHNSVTNRIQQQVKQRQCRMLEETPRYEKMLSLIMPKNNKINLAEDVFLCVYQTDAILSTNLGLL